MVIIPNPPPNDLLPILSLKYNPGPGRNIPPFLTQLKKSKLSLKSSIVIKKLKNMNKVDNLLFIKVKNRLKKISPIKRQTKWPCVNPLFIELRKKVNIKN